MQIQHSEETEKHSQALSPCTQSCTNVHVQPMNDLWTWVQRSYTYAYDCAQGGESLGTSLQSCVRQDSNPVVQCSGLPTKPYIMLCLYTWCYRYDKLLSVVKSSGRGAPPPGMCVVGVSVVGEEVMRGSHWRVPTRTGEGEKVSESV